ncbi:leucine--tRNA ligase [Candidatus Woesearchaeota archaeon]|nr:leucine--tRNA ligase [Candidatus Woesearchaeota archaeon]
MSLDFHKLARKWQRRWKAQRVFESDPSDKPKFFLTTPYPYVNGLLHIGHTYTYMRVDAFARFKRMRGFNVLFPFAWHATGSPIDTAAKKVAENEPGQLNALKLMGFKDEDLPAFKEPLHWVKTFSREAKKDLMRYGMSIDWRREFVTTDLNPRYSKFIKWQFNTLKKKGFVVQGEHPVVWCPKENAPVGDHARAEGEGETPQEMLLVKFKTDGHVFPCATFRPETVFGVTNVWVNPDLTYVEAVVDGEHWMVSEPCVRKLLDQKHDVKELKRRKGSELVGAKVRNPVTGVEVPVLPAFFVSADTGTGVVMSVPAHAPFDWAALKELQDKGMPDAQNLKPVSLIQVEGFGEFPAVEVCRQLSIADTKNARLEEATQLVYKKEFHTGKLKQNTGKYAGKGVQEVKPLLIADLKAEKKAAVMFELVGKVVCRCLARCHVKIVDNQWFLKYSDAQWKQSAMKCLQQMKLYPDKVRGQFEYVLDWLQDWACTREVGLGTNLPWDKHWKVESLSDSTIYNAFYPVIQHLKKISLGKVNDKLFDYVFLGVGNPDDLGVDHKLLDDARREFLYWYPVDFRNSGKDLVQNHLAFYIFNHVALFPEQLWPKGIGVNGYVTIGSKKMSKSKGIFKTLRQVIETFSADVTRVSILSSNEEMNDVDWDSEVAESMKAKLEQWYDFALKFYGKNGVSGGREIDRWMEHQLHSAMRDATVAMDETLYRTAIQRGFFDVQRHLKWYSRRTAGQMSQQVLTDLVELQTLFLAPFTPHVCEEVWSKLGKSGLIVNEKWPLFDGNKVNVQLEQVEDTMARTLDDVQQVLKLAKVEHPKLITLFVAADWKVLLCRKVKELVVQTRDIGQVMKSVMVDFKDRAQEASALVQKFVKDPSRIPLASAHQEAEFQNLVDAVAFLKEVLNCSVEVIKEQDSSELKAKQAMPGKPAILVK